MWPTTTRQRRRCRRRRRRRRQRRRRRHVKLMVSRHPEKILLSDDWPFNQDERIVRTNLPSGYGNRWVREGVVRLRGSSGRSSRQVEGIVGTILLSGWGDRRDDPLVRMRGSSGRSHPQSGSFIPMVDRYVGDFVIPWNDIFTFRHRLPSFP